MTWLLVVIYLNLSVAPPHIEHAEIVDSFHSEQACIKKQKEFIDQSREQNIEVPENLNVGCIPFKRSIM